MNFELKTFDLSSAAIEKCDALIVLLGQSFKPADDVLSTLVAQALNTRPMARLANRELLGICMVAPAIVAFESEA